jgi:hypothetical protein
VGVLAGLTEFGIRYISEKSVPIVRRWATSSGSGDLTRYKRCGIMAVLAYIGSLSPDKMKSSGGE